jgi:hypothetical protein
MHRVICSDYFSVFVLPIKLKQLPTEFIIEEIPKLPMYAVKHYLTTYQNSGKKKTTDEQRIVSHVFTKENLSLVGFASNNVTNETGNFFKTRPRQVRLSQRVLWF